MRNTIVFLLRKFGGHTQIANPISKGLEQPQKQVNCGTPKPDIQGKIAGLS